MNKIEVCNFALGRIGIEPIESLDEASKAARTCKQFYDFVRKTVLRKHSWNFATKREALALIGSTSAEYKYTYAYPGDAVALRRLYNKDHTILPRDNEYRIMHSSTGTVIHTNIENANIEYTADIEDVSVFDEQFIESLAWKLAAEIALILTGSQEIAASCVQAYNAYYVDATSSDANEENKIEPRLNRLARARFEGTTCY